MTELVRTQVVVHQLDVANLAAVAEFVPQFERAGHTVQVLVCV